MNIPKIETFVNGQPVKFGVVTRTITTTKPLYARFPRWLIRLLNWFGVVTTETREVEVFELKEIPPAGAYAVVKYQTTFGED